MRFGTWRVLPLGLSLAAFGMGLGSATQARAQFHTIPREVPAYNYTTGGEYMAPPVPYGHYAKDYVDEAHKCLAGVKGHLLGLCAGHGLLNHGLFNHGNGDGNCNGDGCGGSGGHGLFGHNGASNCGEPDCFGGISCGILGHGKHGGGAAYCNAGAAGFATTISGPSAQAGPVPSGQMACGQANCTMGGKHSHLGHSGGYSNSGSCGDPSCGIGFGHRHGNSAGGQGGCGFCGGRGCGHCLGKLAGLGSMCHAKLASACASLGAALGGGPKVKWFVGAGGPVPLTPGYVPYIVATRSPRDFFAFPPMNPNDP
jgi:hypothetical protein